MITRTRLWLLASKVELRPPAGLEEEILSIIRETTNETVTECCTILAELENEYGDNENGE